MTWIILDLAKPWDREMERLERFLDRPPQRTVVPTPKSSPLLPKGAQPASRWWLWQA